MTTWYTTSQAAQACKVTPMTIRRWIELKKIKGTIRPGHARLIPESEITRLTTPQKEENS